MITLAYIVGALCALILLGVWLYEQIAEPMPRVYEKETAIKATLDPSPKP